ncbi:hypothetical protein ABMY44_06225 [Pseudoalteromonas sp. Cnat2-41]|nr:hypothetical protein [Pseudoalteromonas sp. CNAT2-18.1]
MTESLSCRYHDPDSTLELSIKAKLHIVKRNEEGGHTYAVWRFFPERDSFLG